MGNRRFGPASKPATAVTVSASGHVQARFDGAKKVIRKKTFRDWLMGTHTIIVIDRDGKPTLFNGPDLTFYAG